MCTASWWFGNDGRYELFFNRDEQKSRSPAHAPQSFSRCGTAFLAPIDADGEGSWIATNDFGISVCLLNHHPAPEPNNPLPTRPAPSRGHLVLLGAVAPTVNDTLDRIALHDLGRYRPFKLLALGPDRDIGLLTWNGRRLERTFAPVNAPCTSSSFQSAMVICERQRRFALLATGVVPGTRPPLEMFHDQHDPSTSASSVLMNRPDACTVSQVRIRVSPESATMEYRDIRWAPGANKTPFVISQLQLRPALALAS